MSHTIAAVYENGVFRPLEPVDYPERQCVTVTPVQEPVAGTGSETESVPLQQPDPEERPWRGVFAPARPRRTLFVQEIDLLTSPLPKRPLTLNMSWHRPGEDHE